MTGKFLINQKDKYGRIIFNFDNGYFLTFSDKRRFGNVIFGERSIIEKIIDSVGEDALSISFSSFKFKILNSKNRKIKPALMDQNAIAGIGNIYADEILWKAKINPLRSAGDLSVNELKNIFQSMSFILKKSIKLRGVSIQDYRDVFGNRGEYQNHRLVYGREGEKCKRCGTKTKKIKLAQRSAHFCPKCQI